MTSTIPLSLIQPSFQLSDISNGTLSSSTSSAWSVDSTFNECYQRESYNEILDYADNVPIFYKYNTLDRNMITIVMPCVTILGLVSNISFLFVIWSIKHMRTITNFYLANLAIADMGFVLLEGCQKILSHKLSPVKGTDYMDKAGCNITMLLSFVFYYTSVAVVTLVSVERYCAVLHPLKHRSLSTKRRALVIILSIWLYQ